MALYPPRVERSYTGANTPLRLDPVRAAENRGVVATLKALGAVPMEGQSDVIEISLPEGARFDSRVLMRRIETELGRTEVQP